VVSGLGAPGGQRKSEERERNEPSKRRETRLKESAREILADARQKTLDHQEILKSPGKDRQVSVNQGGGAEMGDRRKRGPSFKRARKRAKARKGENHNVVTIILTIWPACTDHASQCKAKLTASGKGQDGKRKRKPKKNQKGDSSSQKRSVAPASEGAARAGPRGA